jgi:hypothetical protein
VGKHAIQRLQRGQEASAEQDSGHTTQSETQASRGILGRL